MPVFAYRAADRTGRTIQGVMEAHDVQGVVEHLQRQAYFPVAVERTDRGRRLRGLGAPWRVPFREVLAFTQQLATLLEAGVPLDRALQILSELAGGRLRAVVDDVAQAVRGGSTLTDALARHHPRPFSRLYINTVRAGERGGALEVALRRLAEHLEASREFRDALVSAAIYPALLAMVGMGAIVFLLTFVLPRFAVILADLGQALPLPTRVLLGVSEALTGSWWVLLLGLLAAVLGWQVVLRSEPARLALDRWVLSWPVAGDLTRRAEVARLARTLATLLQAGVPVLNALAVAGEVAANRVLALALATVYEGVKRGDGLARAMGDSGAFPPLAVHMVRVGEETGRLEEMLARVAAAYEGEVRVAVRRMLALLEPAIILVLGLVVLAIVLAILMAILTINELPL